MKVTDHPGIRPDKVQGTKGDPGKKGKISELRGEIFDRASFSKRAGEMREIMEMVKGIPEVRESPVLAIKNAMASGTYTVKSRSIAEKMGEMTLW